MKYTSCFSVHFAALFAAALAACGPGGEGLDAGRDVAADALSEAQLPCRTDRECSDGVFCNGAELCAPGDPGANARGCVAPSQTACRATQTCDEANAHCTSDCAQNPDADGDGHRATECGGDDCDDADFSRTPGRAEVCDARNHDEDCDPTTFGARDDDHDGFTDALCCNTDSAGVSHCGNDCDDRSPLINPSSPELCNGADDNCNGMIDEGISRAYHRDADGDRFGSTAAADTMTACTAPAGFVENGTDCDDSAASVSPGAPEVCDGVDNNCNGSTDEGLSAVYHRDADGDLFGDPAVTMTSCGVPTGFVANGTDCDDTAADAHPGALEICDARDNDCNGMTDEAAGRSFFLDRDADGYGSTLPSDSVTACAPPTGYVSRGGDCGDDDPSIHPDVVEKCNGLDDNCDGRVDEPPAGNECGGGQGLYVCAEGSCSLEACPPERDECDNDPSNGCETDTGSDPSNCGGCGNQCGDGGVCTHGQCDKPVGVTVGAYYACVLRSSGRIVCWGDNAAGTLGAGTLGTTRTVVAGISDAVQVSGGAATVCARHATGDVSCWGKNDDGEVGGGTSGQDAFAPVSVLGIHDAIDVQVGDNFACALRRSGEIWCWGAGDRGQLGNGATNASSVPVPVTLGRATALAVGGIHACASVESAIVGSADIECWGDNSLGQLGKGGDGLTHALPESVTGVSTSLAIDAGEAFTCSLGSDGRAECWGSDLHGELGMVPPMPPTGPNSLAYNLPLVQIDVGGSSGFAIDVNGTVIGWGDNTTFQIGTLSTSNPVVPPASVPVDSSVVAIDGGTETTCAVLFNGDVYCWGANEQGQLGLGMTSSPIPTPYPVPNISYTPGFGGPL